MILIKQFATYCEMDCDDKGNISFNPTINIKKVIYQKLCEYDYDPNHKVFIPKKVYILFDKKNKTIRFPINAIARFTQFIIKNNGTYEIQEQTPLEGESVDICFKDNLVDRPRQEPVIGFFTNTNQMMKALKLQTGVGKTYCSVKAISIIKKLPLIVIPNFLVAEWCKEFINFTNVKMDEITVIKGSQSILSIIDDPSIIRNTKVFLGINKTITQYIQKSFDIYNDIIPFEEFLKLLGVGIKVIDECHLLFHSNVLIDLNCNLKHNLYLSASYTRSNKSGNRVFNLVYPEHIKYDDKKYKKYVNITECTYSLGWLHPMTAKTKRGYSEVKYEKWMINKPNKLKSLYSSIDTILDRFYIKKRKSNQKALIFIGLKILGYRLQKYLKERHPELAISTFYEKDKDIILQKSDIIISTTGSCGTGKDIKNLKTIILINSFVSEGLCYQVLGRLRELDNDTPEFIFMQNRNIDSHMHHLHMRRILYRTLGKTYSSIQL